MASGYIKLHRCLLDNPLFDNENLLKVWVWCLLKASHKEHEQLVGLQKVILKPGQFVFGRDKAAAELKLHPSSLYRYVKKLESSERLVIQPNNKFSIVTIENWAFYQGEGDQPEQQNEQQMNNKRTANEQQMNTNKNVKNVKNKDLKILAQEKINHQEMFDEFWQSYPNKKSKGQAEKAWNKIKPDEQLLAVILDALKRAKTSAGWTKENGKWIPHPATWLNAKGWEDEYHEGGQSQEGWSTGRQALEEWANSE